MRGLKGEQLLMRIHIGERDRFQGKPLYEQIVHLLRERGYAGAMISSRTSARPSIASTSLAIGPRDA